MVRQASHPSFLHTVERRSPTEQAAQRSRPPHRDGVPRSLRLPPSPLKPPANPSPEVLDNLYEHCAGANSLEGGVQTGHAVHIVGTIRGLTVAAGLTHQCGRTQAALVPLWAVGPGRAP